MKGLYRVSTNSQVENEDIPIQKAACREFATARGWDIIEEFSEKGISGFKVPTDRREALQEIKKAAIQQCFDVLLVFMFDRLGRRDDETPFVVEWFVKNGIEVWSVVEGQQRFDSHVDKLLNYIRYWQSSGESLKTSIRTKTRMEQLVRDGLFVGGIAPYGYKLCKLGRINKRGKDVSDIVIGPDEASVVKEIFRLYCADEMGTFRIAQHLTRQGSLNHKGLPWHSASIAGILKNPSYIGVRRLGNVSSEPLPHLRIVDEETFAYVARQTARNRRIKPIYTRSSYRNDALFFDQIHCFHCGKRMTVACNTKTNTLKDGTRTTYKRINYICNNKCASIPCSGQRSYSVKRTDQMVTEVIDDLLNTCDIENTAVEWHAAERELLSQLQSALADEQRVQEDLKREVVEVIRGTSAFGSLLLSDLISQSQERLKKLDGKIADAQLRIEQRELQSEVLATFLKECRTGVFPALSTLDFTERKQLLGQLICRIFIGRNGAYRIEWENGGITQLGADVGA